MLRLADARDRAAILNFCGGSLLGTYIACRLQCYGFDYDFVRFWLASTGDHVQAVIGALDHTAILLANEDADYAELRAFLEMLSFSSVMTEQRTAARCGYTDVITKQAFVFSGILEAVQAQEVADMQAVYALIATEISGSFAQTREAYLSFLSDFTYRKNRGAARLRTVMQDNMLCACALTAAETENAAVLSGVASDRRFRGKGFGKRVVQSLVGALTAEGKTPYVIALNDSAGGFYQNLGFQPYMELAILERKSSCLNGTKNF